ncbi:peptide/nickel transport system permease protein [Deinobacterium chartae]|uniref:Peptide/nickel transport system permease protein n=1 Tax=Deinobacterium chartae TaxID=521158 RepID=A0A841HZY1_9DEIO|nr:ABC transporter permease [Deinobacterium chartae]MBB6097295.1 peptide/nickel transport system permease protein [Deinobacterium chartae]
MTEAPVLTKTPPARRRGALGRLWRRPSAVVGIVLLGAVVLMSLLAPWIAPMPENAQNWGERLLPPSAKHPFGTDEFGRSVLSRALYGGRISLLSGILPVLMGGVIGTLLGLLAGYFGGWVDRVLTLVFDILLAFPAIFLALAIVGAFGPGFVNALLAVAVVSIPAYARLVRAEVLRLRDTEFVEAARATGASGGRIVLRHLLPNAFSPLVVQATLSIGYAILATAGLSFLGLGVQPPVSDWGEMLSSGRQYLPEAWWLELFPGLFILATVLGANLLGDALRDALDPRSARR